MSQIYGIYFILNFLALICWIIFYLVELYCLIYDQFDALYVIAIIEAVGAVLFFWCVCLEFYTDSSHTPSCYATKLALHIAYAGLLWFYAVEFNSK